MLKKRDEERADRLEELRNHYELTVNRFAQKLGLSHKNIDEKLKKRSKINYKTFEAIERNFPYVNMEYIKEGKGELILRSNERKESSLFIHEMAVKIRELEIEMLKMNSRVSQLENLVAR